MDTSQQTPWVITILLALGNVAQLFFNVKKSGVDVDKIRKEVELGYLEEARALQRSLREENERYIVRLKEDYRQAREGNQKLKEENKSLKARIICLEEKIGDLEEKLREEERKRKELRDELNAWKEGFGG